MPLTMYFDLIIPMQPVAEGKCFWHLFQSVSASVSKPVQQFFFSIRVLWNFVVSKDTLWRYAYLQEMLIFFSSGIHRTKYSLMKGIQICSSKGPNPFPKGDNNNIAKILYQNFKNLLLQNHWANINHTWLKAFLCEKYYRNHSIIKKEITGFSTFL